MNQANALIYLDNNATTPIDPRVLDEMMPYLQGTFGNAASRTHAYGWDAESAVSDARRHVSRLIGARPAEIVWTSGATESTNLALKGIVESGQLKHNHILTLATEHKATLDTCAHLKKNGIRVTVLNVGLNGLVDMIALEAALADDCGLASIMMVNNESGVIQPMKEIGALCAKHNVILHCDAAQSFGKLPIDVIDLGIHMLSVSGHKIFGPKGVGLLYVRQRNPKIQVLEQIHGGGHESKRRSGTLNVPGIVGLGAAAKFAMTDMESDRARVLGLRIRLLTKLQSRINDTVVNGSLEDRIESNLNISFLGIESEALLMALPEVALSTGSACTSTSVEPSYVLKAMGISSEQALSAVRFGLGRFTTEEEIDRVVDMIEQAVASMRTNRPQRR